MSTLDVVRPRGNRAYRRCPKCKKLIPFSRSACASCAVCERSSDGRLSRSEHLSADEQDEVRRLHRRFVSHREIARRLRIDPGTVANVVNRSGAYKAVAS